jgi:hypothetical protein
VADRLTALPGNLWVNGEFRSQLDPATYRFTTLAEMFARDVALPKAQEYVSPDGTLAIPAYRVFQQGPADHLGWRFSDTLDAYGLVTAKAGGRVFLSNESEDRTYSARLAAGGAMTDLQPFADRGGKRGNRAGRARLHRQWPGLRLRHGGPPDRPHRRARTPPATAVRRQG